MKSKLRWMGHAYTGEQQMPTEFGWENLTGHHFRNSGYRWKDTKMDLKRNRRVWMHLAQDRDQCQALAHMIMKH